MTVRRTDKIQSLLQAAFSPTDILVKDQSHLHEGHAGARDGKGHFEIVVVSAEFEGKSRLERHRMIYEALDSMMQSDIHALRINAFAPTER